MRLLYSLAIRVYGVFIQIASLWNPKAKLWVVGHRNQWQKLKPQVEDKSEWIWFHAASLGEFEQGRPVIEAIKKQHPQYKILLTFFSPSGYEIRKNYPFADQIAYLPLDTMCNARRLIRNYRFKIAIFIKYEFWFNYMKVLEDAHIPHYYISVRLRASQHFFKKTSGWFCKQLENIDFFFVQDQSTADLLAKIGYINSIVNGDTRFDRVAEIAQQAKSFPSIEKFINKRKCIVVGSSWTEDEQLFYSFSEKLPNDFCLIIAPHDISENHIHQIQAQMKLPNVLFSEINANDSYKVLIINSIGILSQLYQYAYVAYIGGGFKKNIHNIQEAITYGCPVIFGPNYKNFNEATDLVQLGGAFAIDNQESFDNVMQRFITDETFRYQASDICKKYVDSQLGATKVIMNYLENVL
ncbi:MAG: 3-deoxy-D-manno-octulosonic acid transferase [Lentimicrobiaceae bacterium]|jgi:3-deoxy-D-manno-octulosonic-acid transferase|nr:3-deoxy-D-manno-octulosonic acid transferase [Lentimicrobiaceae bacterium]